MSILIASLALVLGCGGDDRADVTPTTGSATGATQPQGTGAGGDDGGGGGGGTAGTGGAGGTGTTGGGGTSSEGGGPATGAGGSGGDPWATCFAPGECIGDDVSHCPENACESESLFAECNDGDPAPAYFACAAWADVLRAQVWAYLVDCFRAASHPDLCDSSEQIITACVESVAIEACPSPEADITCAEADAGCAEGGFALDQCEDDLRLFNPEGRLDYAECISGEAADLPCEEQHAHCHESVLLF